MREDNESEKYRRIMSLGHEITVVKDVDILLERILTSARRVTNADAGSIYVREGDDRLRFKCTQNDTLQARLPAGKKLVYSTFWLPINNKSVAGWVAGRGEVVNIPDVARLPPGVPYSFDGHYDEVSGYRTRSMLTFPLKNPHGGVVGVLQLINARDEAGAAAAFDAGDEPFVLHFADYAAVALERALMTRAIILRMIRMAELRDPKETGAHVNRVAAYAVEIYETWAAAQGMQPGDIEKNKDVLRMAAMLHDVGKVAISDTILKKPARLDPEEFAAMKEHTFLGARLFSDPYSDFDEAAMIVALNHHERWDGGGYPGHVNPQTGKPVPGYETPDGKGRGKRGEEIPPLGRVVAIADVYDALSSRRVYKEAWDEGRVLETLQNEAGRQFDPEMIKAFFSSIDVLRMLGERYPD